MNKGIKEEAVKETIFDVIIEMLFIAFVFLVPIIFDRRVGIVFSNTKQTTIRLLMLAIIAVWVLKVLLKNKHNFVRSPLDWPVAAYMLACTVATVTSVYVLVSFMGFYGRYEGLTTLWAYGFLYFLTINFIRRKEQMNRVFYTVIAAGVFMSIYSIMQRAGLDPYAWGGVVTWMRVIGTIGQPNFLAAYVDMAFIVGLAVLMDVSMKKLGNGRNEKLYRTILNAALIIGLAVIFICILFTQSRGGFLGLFAGSALFFSLIHRDLIIRNWKKLALLFFIILTIGYVTMLNPVYSPIARMAYEAERIEESHKQETPIIKYSAALSRLETWKSGYRIMTAYPFFGIGPEVMKMIFPQFETEYFRFYEGFHVKQDRMHNEICDMGATRGIVTLAIYVWMLSTFFWMGAKILRSDKDIEMKLMTAALLGASTAYLIQNQFSFGVVAITSLLWIMMGLVASIYAGGPSVVEREDIKFDLSKFPWLYIAVLAVFVVTLGYYGTLQFRADAHYKSGKVYSRMKRFDYAVAELERSIEISPYEGGVWTHMAIGYLNLAQNTRRKDLLEKAIAILKKATEVDPYNADNFYILGRSYMIKSIYDKSVFPEVLVVEDKAIKIDPRYAEAYQIKGMVYERLGDYDKAFDMYVRAIEVNPTLRESTTGLLNLSAKRGTYNRAIEVFKDFLVKYPDNILYLENLGMAYVRKGDTDKALEAYLNIIEVDPKNITALVNIGFLYGKENKLDRAREKFNEVIMIDPKNVDGHNGLGLLYLKKGNIKKAKEEFNQVLMLDPNNRYAKSMLERIK
ncbi:tetratricopeptide repeat protein [Candidatus Margulisiibacteriota bacterium]